MIRSLVSYMILLVSSCGHVASSGETCEDYCYRQYSVCDHEEIGRVDHGKYYRDFESKRKFYYCR